MTHDELLATVQFNKQTLESSDRNSDALRAVVELHKPTNSIFKMQFVDDENIKFICNCCGWPIPCPTIQAIEKELK